MDDGRYSPEALRPFDRFRFDGFDTWPAGFSHAVEARTAIVRLYDAGCLKIAQLQAEIDRLKAPKL